MRREVPAARRRLSWVVALLAAFVGASVMSVTASAVNPNIYDFVTKTVVPAPLGQGIVPDPQTTNYPGQAAIGQTMRFSFCAPTAVITAGTAGQADLDAITPLWTIANWTGDDMPFQVATGAKVANAQHLGLESCFFVDYGSHKPGLLDLKFFATFTGTATTADPLVNHHNFLGIWQEIYDVTLSVDETGKQLHKQNPAKYDDPNLAGKDGVPIMAKVRGSFPLGSKAKKGGKSTVILPDDFGWLAQQFAVDGSNVSFGGSGAAYRWDIHDDQVINKKTKKDVQHPYCQTYYPWTDANGFNLYKEPPTANKATSIPHPYYCDPTAAKRPVPKNPEFFTIGTQIQDIITENTLGSNADIDIINFSNGVASFTPSAGGITAGVPNPTAAIAAIFANPFTAANMVPWPANDEDSVTNQTAGGTNGQTAFSDILGRPLPGIGPVGPYDSHRVGTNTAGVESVYYPNGVTNAGDATAPAWRIDFQIQPNGSAKKGTKGKDAIDGAGFLAEVDKNLRVHFDKNGDEDFTVTGASQIEESTGPFLRRQIPALRSDRVGVGTTNSLGSAQNSNGYLAPAGTNNAYNLWDLVHTGDIDQNRGRPTACTDFFSNDGTIQNVRSTPGSQPTAAAPIVAPDLAVVYADEHGQGEVQLKPGLGFYFDTLGVKPTSQFGCDLQGIDLLGTATVIATAHYPDQQAAGGKPIGSNPITKWWVNGFNVQLSFAPKGGNNPGWRITAWKTDIDGNAPDASRNEVVCLSAPNGTVIVPTLPTNLVNNTLVANVALTATQATDLGFAQGAHVACAFLALRGTANANVASAFFDLSGDPGQTVFANFVTEQIKRSITISATGSGGNAPTVDGNGKPIKPGTFAKAAGPTNAQLKGAGLLTTTRIAKINRVKYKRFRGANGKITKGKILVKAQSPTTKVRLKLTLVGKNKQGSLVTLRTIRKTIKANTKKFVKVKVIRQKRLAKRIRRVDAVIVRTQGRLIS